MKKALSNLALVSLAFLVAFALAEVAVRILHPQDLTTSFRRQTGNGVLHSPGSGVEVHQFGDMKVRYGFHEPYLRDSAHVPGRENVLVIGDSFTFGWLLPAEQTYIHHLQARIDAQFPGQINLMNGAAPATGTADHAAFLEDLALDSHPDRIIIFFNIDDADRAERSGLFSWDSKGGVLERQLVRPSPLKQALNRTPGYTWLLAHSHFVQLARLCWTSRCGRTIEVAGPVARDGAVLDNGKTKALYLRMRDWAAENKLPLLVLTTGWPELEVSPYTSRFLADAENFFSSAGIDFCDIRPAIQSKVAANIPLYEVHPRDHHPSAAGAQLIAEAAWDRCLKQRLAVAIGREQTHKSTSQ